MFNRLGWQHRPRMRLHERTLLGGAARSDANSCRVHGCGRAATAFTKSHTFPVVRVQRAFRFTNLARSGSPAGAGTTTAPFGAGGTVWGGACGVTFKTCWHTGQANTGIVEILEGQDAASPHRLHTPRGISHAILRGSARQAPSATSSSPSPHSSKTAEIRPGLGGLLHDSVESARQIVRVSRPHAEPPSQPFAY